MLDGRTLQGLWRDNMQELGLYGRCVPFIETTEMAAHLVCEVYDVLLIDADHSYEAVKRDFELFAPRIPVGGHVVFDDVPTWHGPTKFHREVPRDEWKLVEYWPNQAVFRRLK
jgi:predicted O-methyltransferase YrrM